MNTPGSDLTPLLAAAGRGDRAAWDRLIPLVYDELKQLAASQMQRERSNHTIQPTALVHEAFVRLAGQRNAVWNNPTHFYGAAAEVMRRILVDFARTRKAAKRGGGVAPVSIENTLVDFEEKATDIVLLDDAMQRLAEFAPDQARIVELRFFGGLSVEQTAEVMSVSTATIQRGWRIAKAWLLRELSNST